MEKKSSLPPPVLIPELGHLFYTLGWMTGTGDTIFVTPSGIQKERLTPSDLFLLDFHTRSILKAPTLPVQPSACTPLFYHCFQLRDAGACIHTHSQNALLVTLIYPGPTFTITNQEMIKGIRRGTHGPGLANTDTLVVPIIENAPTEEDLSDGLTQAMSEYPDTCAILVRNHGVFVWGATWEKAKTMTECYDYLFEVAIKMKQLGMDPHC
ncbi:Methylthioribulose-1-phosphate dehydratase [Dimargaris cristalligena]|nr:Methylthioribulose-1-phosphate dehydratase [Dimargaris cristalligena]